MDGWRVMDKGGWMDRRCVCVFVRVCVVGCRQVKPFCFDVRKKK